MRSMIKSDDEGHQSKRSTRGKSKEPDTSKKGYLTKRNKFKPPYKASDDDSAEKEKSNLKIESDESKDNVETLKSEKYKNLDPRMVELIEAEILESSASVSWDDIAGLDFAKETIKEIIILPLLRPDIYKGWRSPSKGVLLFGPPGTGKTMIGKAIATQSNSTFFSISSSTLTSKWVGEGEKMV